MKRSLVLIMALLLATPALGTVDITCTDAGSGRLSISYNASTETELVRAFALDITIDAGATFAAIDSNSFTAGQGNVYGIFPGSIDLTDPNTPVYGDPIAPSSDPGAAGTGIGTNRVIIEMGSLYEPNLSGPGTSGTLCTFQLEGDTDCNVVIVAESTRGGVVLEDGSIPSLNSPGCLVALGGWVYPDCWGYSGTGYQTQCHADTDGNANVGLTDFYVFRDGWNKSYSDPDYITNACADIDRDGSIGLTDFYEFRDNWNQSVASDCSSGDYNEIFKP